MCKHLWYVFYGKWVRVIEVQCGYSNHFQIQLPRQPPAIQLLLRLLLLHPPQPPPQLQVGDNFIPVYILLSKGYHYVCTKGKHADILGPCTQIPPTSLDELIFYVRILAYIPFPLWQRVRMLQRVRSRFIPVNYTVFRSKFRVGEFGTLVKLLYTPDRFLTDR